MFYLPRLVSAVLIGYCRSMIEPAEQLKKYDPHPYRQLLAGLLVLGAAGLLYWGFGRAAIVGAAAMVFVLWFVFGILTGWWLGRNSLHDAMHFELQRKLQRGERVDP